MDSGALYGVADEIDCGICQYIDPTLRPVGGLLKACPEDFRVSEITQPTGASLGRGASFASSGSAASSPPDDGEPRFLRFQLHKRGVDTLEAVDSLATACKTPSRFFGFGGIKDAWAITTQDVTVPRDLLTQAMLLQGAEELPQLRLSNFRPGWTPLAPGALGGNRFLLRLRGVRVSARRVRAAVRTLRRRGFLNYVGMQRFGKAGVRSDLVGLALLRAEYETCVDLLLRQAGPQALASGAQGPGSGRHRNAKWTEAFQRTGSATAALRLMPPGGNWAERRLLQALRHRQNQEGGTLPPKPGDALRRKALSDADADGDGDAAPPAGPGRSPWSLACREAFLSLPKSVRLLYAHAYVDRLWNLGATERIARHGQVPVPGDHVRDGTAALPLATRALRPGETGDGFTIFDVLLPRPGENGELPDNSIGALMRSYLTYDRLDPLHLCLEATIGPPHTLRSTERSVVSRPRRLRWSTEWPSRGCGARTLVLDFGLEPGQYATMAMRELMRKRPPARPPRHVFFDDSGSEPESGAQGAPEPAKKRQKVGGSAARSL